MTIGGHVVEYIYILINPSLIGKLKIGKTRTSPEKRAKEISSATGVPTPFIVAYEAVVGDCDAAERAVHETLAARGYRITPNREFFDVTLKYAVDIVNHICNRYPPLPDQNSPDTNARQVTRTGRPIFLEVLEEFYHVGIYSAQSANSYGSMGSLYYDCLDGITD